jgi:hypothetical protein
MMVFNLVLALARSIGLVDRFCDLNIAVLRGAIVGAYEVGADGGY